MNRDLEFDVDAQALNRDFFRADWAVKARKENPLSVWKNSNSDQEKKNDRKSFIIPGFSDTHIERIYTEGEK